MASRILRCCFNLNFKEKTKYIYYSKKVSVDKTFNSTSTKVDKKMEENSNKSGQAFEKLREFGYAFNADGQLRKIDETTGEIGEEPFVFNVYDDQTKNQEHYEKLAEQIPEIVYDLLEQNGLCRTYVPMDVPQENASFFFTQPETLNNSKKLLVIIHGSGYVRAGQWARSLIINNSIDHGTQIPYIKKAQSLGYDILITNTNDNFRMVDGVAKQIPVLNTALTHAHYVWSNYVLKSNPGSVAIVAHSYGGIVTLNLAKTYLDFFKEKVFAIALTDSVHYDIPKPIHKVIANISCNWVSSNKPIDMEIKTSKSDIQRVSAGTEKHEWTSYTAFESVFKFLENKYAAFLNKKTEEIE